MKSNLQYRNHLFYGHFSKLFKTFHNTKFAKHIMVYFRNFQFAVFFLCGQTAKITWASFYFFQTISWEVTTLENNSVAITMFKIVLRVIIPWYNHRLHVKEAVKRRCFNEISVLQTVFLQIAFRTCTQNPLNI